jgi:hypothetical protein
MMGTGQAQRRTACPSGQIRTGKCPGSRAGRQQRQSFQRKDIDSPPRRPGQSQSLHCKNTLSSEAKVVTDGDTRKPGECLPAGKTPLDLEVDVDGSQFGEDFELSGRDDAMQLACLTGVSLKKKSLEKPF